MAIVQATYTKSRAIAKAAIRYIENRPDREGHRGKRELSGIDGTMDRQQAYQMIDEPGKGTAFFRLVISPDPRTEDTVVSATPHLLYKPDDGEGAIFTQRDYSVKPRQTRLTASRETHTPLGHVSLRRLSPSRRISKAAA
jgi:hypothetical protein